MNYLETEKVELKEKWNDQIAKEIEAFLNTEGGAIYLGVTDEGNVVGVDQLDIALRRISDVVSDQIEPSAIDCVQPEVIFDDGKVVIKINITKGFSSLYCIKKYGFSPSGCHLRVGTTCKSMTLSMIKERFEKGLAKRDLMVQMPSYYGDISFRILKMLLLERGCHLEEANYEKNLKLRTLNGEYNVLAELLSDTNSTSLIFAKFKGLTKASYSERTDYGNQCLALAYEKMKGRLELENICKTITSVRPRKDIYLYDADAVNEALINALIHNDYRIASPLVCFFDDRLEILSHGGLPAGLSKEEFFQGISRPRNTQLTEIFQRLGIAEHTGHGIPMILQKYGEGVFDIQPNHINVIIPFNKEVLANHGGISASISGSDGGMNRQENAILGAVETNPSLSAQELSCSLKIPFRSVQRYLANLKTKGILARIGSNKTGYWKVLI